MSPTLPVHQPLPLSSGLLNWKQNLLQALLRSSFHLVQSQEDPTVLELDHRVVNYPGKIVHGGPTFLLFGSRAGIGIKKRLK